MRAFPAGFRNAIVLASLLFVGVASADEARDQSRAAFRRGVIAAKENSFVVARDAFAEAYRLFPHPSILLNLGIAHAKTGELVDAEQELVKFIADDGGATNDEMKSAQRTLAEVREKLGTIGLEVSPPSAKATLDGKPLALIGGQTTQVRAIAGRHTLKVEAEGHKPYDQPVEVLAKIETPLKVDLVSLKPAGGGGATPEEIDPKPSGGSMRGTVGWSLLGLGVVCAGAGTYFGVRTLMLQSEWNDPAIDPDKSVRERGEQYRPIADIAFAAAIVSGGIGAYLLLTRPKAAPSSAKASLVVAPTYAGVTGRF